jgi:hypothetical protein
MRVAFDVHGVLDTHAEYRSLMRTLYAAGQTVYVISGQALDDEMKEFLDKEQLAKFYTHYYGVESYLLDQGYDKFEQRECGRFWPDDIWNPVKAEICVKEDIDMIFDDSPVYAETFTNIKTHFNLVINKEMFHAEILTKPKHRF